MAIRLMANRAWFGELAGWVQFLRASLAVRAVCATMATLGVKQDNCDSALIKHNYY
jgi:hypothetical protein